MSPQLKSYYTRKQEFIKILGGKCVQCGTDKNLEFDHMSKKDKSFCITDKMCYSKKVLLEEIKKCQLLCNSCHLLKNKIDNGEAKHGSISMYRHHKCRCEDCRKVWNIKTKQWKKR